MANIYRYNGQSISSANQTSLPNWLKEYSSKLEKIETLDKEAVESAKTKQVQTNSLIQQILGVTPKFSSVEEAVHDLQKRTGLQAYLELTTKKANQVESLRTLFKKYPDILTFINNRVESSKDANVISDDLSKSYLKQYISTDLEEPLRSFIFAKVKKHSEQLQENRESLPSGKMDNQLDMRDNNSNNDYFASCMPSK